MRKWVSKSTLAPATITMLLAVMEVRSYSKLTLQNRKIEEEKMSKLDEM